MTTEEQPENPSETEIKLFTFEILKLIKNAQQQHGLRHGDYQRYRGYCSRRIRRLRKVLKLPQGDRRHFKKRDVTDVHLTRPDADERYLHVPLVLAERCWAYAMQLRQEANTEPRKKFHLVQKLRKSCVYALQLEELSKLERCDARTKLEAQAYAAWIHGTLQFELQLWNKAATNLKKAQMIYDKLLQTLPESDQLPYKQRIDEIAPTLRYCAYNIGDEKAVDLFELRSQGILENFDALVKQSKEKIAEVLHEIQWFDMRIPVKNERIRLFLIGIEGLDDSLKQAGTSQAKIKLLENMFIDLRDVITLARDNARGEHTEQLLLAYLISIRVERTSQRNLLLIGQTKKAQDIVRLLDIIIQQTNELKQNESIKDSKKAQDYFTKELEAYRALRIYYLACNQASQKRWQAAAALYNQAHEICKKVKIENDFKPELKDLLKMLNDSEIDSVISQANYVLDKEDQDVQGIVVPQKVYKSKKPLIERLDEFREEPQLLVKNGNPNLVPLPPPMEPVPVKPLFYDLALNYIEFPDLQDKLDGGQKQKKGAAGISDFVKGLWGWGKK